MKFSSGEKKMLAFCLIAIALPLGVGLTLNRINATPTVSIPAPSLAPKPNGYDLYVAAAAKIGFANPPVDPVNNPTLITDPKIIAQQYSLARKTAWLQANNAGFTLFNQAIKTPSLAPSQRINLKKTLPEYAQLRELARQKVIESNARWMRNDYDGALQSGLDTIQMGHDMRRGGVVITHLVGVAIGAIGRSVTHDTVEKLDANQSKTAARRLEKLLETRWSLAQTLTEDKYYSQNLWLEVFKTKGWRSPNSLQKNMGFTAATVPELLTNGDRIGLLITPKQRIMDDIVATYDREIANSKQPYLKRGKPLEIADDPFQQVFGISPLLRFNDARDLAGDQLLMFRLALHAYRLENGVYPPSLKALVPAYLNAIPADPYGSGESWRYKLNGQNYRLWSIGPDGKDDGGTPIPWRNGNARKPVAGRRERLPYIMPDSVGDYVAGKNG